MGAKPCLMSTYRAIVVTLSLGALIGCGSGIHPENTNPITDSRLDIPWPPEASPARTISDDEVTLLGNQFSSSGGSAEFTLPDTFVTFSPAETLSYAIYSLTGFGSGIDLGSIVCAYTVEDPIGSEGSTRLFFGVSNYTSGGWSWHLGDPDSPDITFLDGADFPSGSGDIHIAVVHQGLGTAELHSIIFNRVGDTSLQPPENLVATPDVNEILLTWDASPGASGYNVYRNHERANEEYELLNPSPLLVTTFLDETVARNRIYYYRVSAIASNESEMGERVDIFSPQEDLYLPQNYQVTDRGTDFFRVSWDWEGEDPDGWTLFLKEEDDFDLLEPITSIGIPVPFVHSYKFSDLVPGRSYFWRVCATVDGKRGRMTDDFPGVTEGLWTWEPIEEIGSGTEPLAVVTVDNDLSVVYVSGLGGDFARRNEGTWTTETALTTMVQNGVVISVDMAYGNGKYVIVGQDFSPHDVISVTGTPGNWQQVRLDGDGNTGNGHPTSGSNLKVVANDNSFLTSYLIDDSLQFAYQITPTDTINWTSRTILWPIHFGDIQYSLAATDDNIYLLWYLFEDGNKGLKLHSYDDAAWGTLDVFPDGPSEIGYYNDLTMSSTGEWFTPAYESVAYDMYFANGTSAPWESVIAEGDDRQGANANMAAVGDKMFSVFRNRDLGIWMLAIYDAGAWEISPLSVPGAEMRVIKLAAIGDAPYIVFHDEDGDIIKCAPGTPPVL